jgi:RNA ligase
MDIVLLEKMIEEKYVTVQKHPTASLFIYNYSPKAQYDSLWNESTLAARGLIMDEHKNIRARPFSKFFNLEELNLAQIPNLPFEVFEKLDGSLGILYWLHDQVFIATRGSFSSEQAIHASEILHRNYSHTFEKLDKNKTYLFEIIYPSNKIVLDYGEKDDLILLAVIDTASGREENCPEIGFPIVKKYDGLNDLQQLKALEEANKEGFVVRFSNGFRLKVKFAEYVRLHRIITQVSNILIWETLSQGDSFEDMLQKVPDEFYNWVKKTENDLRQQFESIENEARAAFKILESRKETALYFQTQKYPSVLFAILDGKSVAPIIWKMIRPTFSKPFRSVEN